MVTSVSIPFTAVGMRFRGGHVFEAKDNIEFEPEPDNKFDPNAIKIMVERKHVAYVSKEDTNKIKNFINTNGEVQIVETFAQSVAMQYVTPVQ